MASRNEGGVLLQPHPLRDQQILTDHAVADIPRDLARDLAGHVIGRAVNQSGGDGRALYKMSSFGPCTLPDWFSPNPYRSPGKLPFVSNP